jgi:hypothetical protein
MLRNKKEAEELDVVIARKGKRPLNYGLAGACTLLGKGFVAVLK